MWEQDLEKALENSAQADSNFALPHFEGFEAVEELTVSSQEAGWDAEYHQLSCGELFVSNKHQAIDQTSIIIQSVSQRLYVEGVSPKNCMTFLMPLSDTRIRINGEELTENDFVVLEPGADLLAVSPRNASLLALHISEDKFEEHSKILLSSGSDLFKGVYQAKKKDPLIGGLQRNMIHAMYRRRESNFDSQFESEMITQLIQIMASRSQLERRTERLTQGGRQRALSRALEFVEENYSQTLKITELCSHANISLSTLERIFTRELQVTPVQYLKVRRLHAVRSEIADSQDSRSIAEIATRNGFAHLGRFSAAYKNQFGVLPKIDRRKSASIL